jgi:hypothetical protein
MGQQFIRIYKKLDVSTIKQHLLIYGDLSAQCANCQEMDLKLNDPTCPKCHAEFKYLSFRNIKNHLPKLQRISENRPDVLMIDYEDYSRQIGALKAKEFLK